MRLFLSLLLLCSLGVTAQKYFVPVDGGFAHVDTGEKYHRVWLPGVDSIRIYNALDKQLQKVFRGSNYKDLRKQENISISVRGNIPYVIGKTYNYTFTLEFRVRNGYYQYEFTAIDLISDETVRGKHKRLLIQASTKVIKEEKHKNYLLRKKNRPNPVFLRSYNDLIRYTDILCDGFDIRNNF